MTLESVSRIAARSSSSERGSIAESPRVFLAAAVTELAANAAVYLDERVALQRCARARRLYGKLRFGPGLATTLYLKGLVEFRRGNLARARNHYERVVATSRAPRRLRLRTRLGLASLELHEKRGDAESAARDARRLASELKRLGDAAGELHARETLAEARVALHDWEGAAETLKQVVKLAERAGEPYLLASSLNNLAHALTEMSEANATEAERHARRAVAVFESIGIGHEAAYARETLAEVRKLPSSQRTTNDA